MKFLKISKNTILLLYIKIGKYSEPIALMILWKGLCICILSVDEQKPMKNLSWR